MNEPVNPERVTETQRPVSETEPAPEPATEPDGAPGLAGEQVGEAVPPPPAPPPVPVPGFGSGLSKSLDLSVHAAPRLRQASIYIGLLYLAVLAPVVVLLAAMIVRMPELTGMFDIPPTPLEPSDTARAAAWFLALLPVMVVATCGLIAIAVDSQIIAMLILAGQLTNRPVRLREAVAFARERFWPVLRATFLIGIPTGIVSLVLTELFGPYLGATSEGPALVASLLTAFVMLPFVYVGVATTLGDVGAVEAARRSMRLERARYRLAVLIAVFSAAIGYIQLFAVGSGGDILIRIGSSAGLGLDRGTPAAVLTIAIGVAAIVALGSLSFTVTALAAAPQVLGFTALTGYLDGLERGRSAASVDTRPFRWISRPMFVGVAIGALFALVALLSLSQS